MKDENSIALTLYIYIYICICMYAGKVKHFPLCLIVFPPL